ncbi:hypothetical protein V1514DRAFT_324477 [Lipomyces japonicus]|uniref:uncharacterized protein n=1 Tax=Lipomyces japonicus TaxID=56871 RepID=UPI0034CD7AEE
MGSQISQVAPSAPTVGIESYVDELGDIQYDKTCRSARFMKTIKGRNKDGRVIVKVFIKPIANLSLRTYQRQLSIEREKLADASHAVAYSRIVETERAGYLVRQHFGNILYDRISTRPFLENVEKRWIAFQLLSGLQKCHFNGVHHGDIKTENILVTSWNWVYLSDFASFKPTYLPEDDPADFSFFFDTSLRRVCYVAPERFFKPGERKRGQLTDQMDIFSLGCVIAELFLEGSPIFTLSQLFGYRRGTFSPDLSKIEDVNIRSLVQHMVSLDPNDRLSAEGYLNEWHNKAFPDYFYSFLHEYVQDITEPSVLRLGERSLASQFLESDYRLERIYSEFDKVAYFLQFEDQKLGDSSKTVVPTIDPIPVYLNIPNYHSGRPVSIVTKPLADNGALIFLSIVVAAVRNTATATARIHACDVILAFGEQLPDEAKLDRCLPYLVALLDDSFVNVKIAAMRSITQLVALVQRITPVNENVFSEYIMPRMQPLLTSRDVFVRASYASCISTLAETALKFLDMAQAEHVVGNRLAIKDVETENGITTSDAYKAYFEISRRELVDLFQDHAIVLLTDTDSSVKRTLLRSISSLCAFFGSQKANDIILSHLITYLNDKDALLRGAFFNAIIGLATFVGGNSLEEYIMPLMVQALADTEEFVIEKVLYAFTSLAELGLIKRPNLWDLVKITVRFSLHPNLWIREGVFAFISAATKWLSAVDIYCIIRPIVKPYLQCEILDYSETMLMDFCEPPLSRIVFHTAILWASESRYSNFWKSAKEQKMSDIVPMFDGSYSITSSLHNLAITKASEAGIVLTEKQTKTEEDRFWFNKLKVMGLAEKDIWKLAALREHIWRIAKSGNNNSKLFAFQRQHDSDLDMNSAISVNKLGVQLHTYFFDDTKTTIRRPINKLEAADSRRQQFKVTTTLLDALKTIDNYQRQTQSSLPTKRTGLPPHWLNGIEGSPRTLGPILAIGSPSGSNGGTVLFSQSNGASKYSASSVVDRTEALSDSQAEIASEIGEPLESEITISRELRRRTSAVTLISHRDHDLDHIGKSAPEVASNPTVVYGQVDRPVSSKGDQKNRDMIQHEIGSYGYDNGSDEETMIETVVYRGHSYTGDDPYILKLLDTVYFDKFMEDISEFGPLIPPSSRPHTLVKSGKIASSGWRPDGNLIASFNEHKGPVNRVVVSADHFFFLTASDDGTVKIWDTIQLERNVINRARLTYRHSQSAKVKCLCFIDSTHCFASGATDGTINIIRVNYTPPIGRGIPKYGRLLTLRTYRLNEGEYATWMEQIKIESRSILMIATNKSRILALNLRSLTLDFVLENPIHHGVPSCFFIDRKRAWMVVGTTRGVLDVWSLRYQIHLKAWGLHGGSTIYRIGLHPTLGKGKWICVAGGSNVNGDEITVWDVEKTQCREVYRTSSVGDAASSESVQDQYEPLNVDDEDQGTLLNRIAGNPVLLLERSESSVKNSVRAFCMGAVDVPSSSHDEWDNTFTSTNGSSRNIPGGFLISACSDHHTRFWNLGKPEQSSVISGPLAEVRPKPSYNIRKPNSTLTISTEIRDAVVPLSQEPAMPGTNSSLGPIMDGAIKAINSATGKRRNTSSSSRPGPPNAQSSRPTLISAKQQATIKNHADAVLDVALLCRPYGLIVSVDRAGVVKVFS